MRYNLYKHIRIFEMKKVYRDSKRQKKFMRFVKQFYKGSLSLGGIDYGDSILDVYQLYLVKTPPKSVSPYPDPIRTIYALCQNQGLIKYSVISSIIAIACLLRAVYTWIADDTVEPLSFYIGSLVFCIDCLLLIPLILKNLKVVEAGFTAMIEFVELLQILGFRMNNYTSDGFLARYEEKVPFKEQAHNFLIKLASNWKFENSMGRHTVAGEWQEEFVRYNHQLFKMGLVDKTFRIEDLAPAAENFKISNSALPFT
jgi:hypothetical protein